MGSHKGQTLLLSHYSGSASSKLLYARSEDMPAILLLGQGCREGPGNKMYQTHLEW